MYIQFLRQIKSNFTYVLLITLLSHFILFNGSTATFVLCFGLNDDHIAVEYAAHNHADEALHSSLNAVDSGIDVSSADSPCNDIPIFSDEGLLDLSKLSFDIGLVSTVFFVLIFLAFFHQIAPLSLFLDLWFTDPRVLSLRSIVLLI